MSSTALAVLSDPLAAANFRRALLSSSSSSSSSADAPQLAELHSFVQRDPAINVSSGEASETQISEVLAAVRYAPLLIVARTVRQHTDADQSAMEVLLSALRSEYVSEVVHAAAGPGSQTLPKNVCSTPTPYSSPGQPAATPPPQQSARGAKDTTTNNNNNTTTTTATTDTRAQSVSAAAQTAIYDQHLIASEPTDAKVLRQFVAAWSQFGTSLGGVDFCASMALLLAMGFAHLESEVRACSDANDVLTPLVDELSQQVISRRAQIPCPVMHAILRGCGMALVDPLVPQQLSRLLLRVLYERSTVELMPEIMLGTNALASMVATGALAALTPKQIKVVPAARASHRSSIDDAKDDKGKGKEKEKVTAKDHEKDSQAKEPTAAEKKDKKKEERGKDAKKDKEPKKDAKKEGEDKKDRGDDKKDAKKEGDDKKDTKKEGDDKKQQTPKSDEHKKELTKRESKKEALGVPVDKAHKKRSSKSGK